MGAIVPRLHPGVIGLCMVRNAEDIARPVVAHMTTQVDHVFVFDNLSDDRTRPILDELAAENRAISIVDDRDPAHRQSAKMSRWAELFHFETGAGWVVPFDIDEVWYSPFGRIGDVLSALPLHVWTASATLYDHVVTGLDDASEPNPVRRIGWRRRAPGPLPKVACRLSAGIVIEEGNHGAHYGHPIPPANIPGQLVVRHYPYRSAEQMAEKARIGAEALRLAEEVPEHIGQHWRDYDRLGPDLLAEVFDEHYYAARPDRRTDLIFDPAPVPS